VRRPVLVIACGALAREITQLKRSHGWDHLHLQCIDARLHMRPALIPERVREQIRKHKDEYDQMFVAYADCGTSGELDRVLEEEGVERLPGAHCYQFFAGADRFAKLSDAEPGTFYLTDFLARHFERMVIQPLKLDEHPELYDAYFGNYRRLVFLSQTTDEGLLQAAKDAAKRLTLEFEHVHCGYGGLQSGLKAELEDENHGQESTDLLA
jgi:hypothetical protein